MHPNPRRISRAVALLAIAVATSGCASMSREECQALDWRTVGYEDGVRGATGDRIGEHRKACAEYGVRPDLDAYRTGRESGLREFCREGNGYRVGLAGVEYAGVCPSSLEPEFLRGYEAGRSYYVLEARVANADAALEARRRELDGLEHGIVWQTAAVVDGASTPQDRVDAVVGAANLAERMGRLKQEIAGLEYELAQAQRELDAYRAAHPTRP